MAGGFPAKVLILPLSKLPLQLVLWGRPVLTAGTSRYVSMSGSGYLPVINNFRAYKRRQQLRTRCIIDLRSVSLIPVARRPERVSLAWVLIIAQANRDSLDNLVCSRSRVANEIKGISWCFRCLWRGINRKLIAK